jgi:hypothetical protein
MHSRSNTAPTEADTPFVSWYESSPPADRDRRAHERLVAHELEWLKSARLRSGPSLSLIDLSAGGALFETSTPLGPGTTSTLTLVGSGIAETATFRLLRCEVASLKNGLVYRGACVFDRVLRLPSSLIAADNRSAARPAEASATAPQGGLKEEQILALIQSVARRTPEAQVGRNIAAIIAETRAALERGESPQVILRLIETQLGVAGRPIAALEAPRGGRFEPSRLAPAAHATDPKVGAGWNRIVVRYLDGRLLKGFSQDFHPTRPTFHVSAALSPLDTRPVLVPMQQLKAVFFVRDFEGDPAYVERRTFEQRAAGRRIEVTFLDDEVLLGSTLGYRPDGTGFFMTPADGEGNNLRVFVLPGAVRHIRYL